ncbi:MAG: hypothetical protein MJ252_21965 [archaeon]|nr:hypothetical protein [archaeon]
MKISAKVVFVVVMIQCLSRITPLLRKKNQRRDSGIHVTDLSPKLEPLCWTENIIKENGQCKYTSLNQILIPATHDSGFYINPLRPKYEGKFSQMTFPVMFSEKDMETKSSDPSKKEKAELGKFVLEKGFEKYNIQKFSVTQYYDLLTQMKMGIRLFDIRFEYSTHFFGGPTFELNHGVLTKDISLEDTLKVAAHFLSNLCKKDFLIFKLKIDGKDPTEFTLKTILDPQNGVSDKVVFFPEGYMPTIEEIQGKLWILPDKDFKAKDILKFNPELIKNNPNGLPPATWKSAVMKGHDMEVSEVEDKISEYTKWKENIEANKKEDQGKLMYFGFNVVSFNKLSIAGLVVSDVFTHSDREIRGTRDGIKLFDYIYMKDLKKPKRGVIGMDWAMPFRIKSVLDSFNPSSCGKREKRFTLDESSETDTSTDSESESE